MNPAEPTFSVVVPTRNRPLKLARLLECLTELEYPLDCIEVIVVNDGGDEDIGHVVKDYLKRFPITLISQENRGPAHARQTGINRAAGRYLAFTDDDCRPAPNWLTVLEARLTANPNCAVGGLTVNELCGNPYSEASQTIISYLYERLNPVNGAASFFTTNNLAMPAALCENIGGLDTTWSIPGGEDRDLCDRWTRHGYGLLSAPDAVVRHSHDLTFAKYWRQQSNYGRGAYRYFTTRPADGAGVRPQSPSFYIGLVANGWKQAPLRRKPFSMLLMIVAQIANLTGYLGERFNSRSIKLTMAEAPVGAPKGL